MYNKECKIKRKKNHKARSRYSFVKNKENRKLMKTASKEYKYELTKYFQTRFETDPKKFWIILNRIDRFNEKVKISIDNLYEYFKDLNNYNDIDDESEFDITYDNYFINSSIDGMLMIS